MSIHKHCDWCKKDCGYHSKIAVNNDQWHFCSYAHAKLWFEKEEVVYEVKDRGRKEAYWADRRRIEREANLEAV
jgi:hypothetical protein